MLRKFDIKSDLFVAISMIRVMVYSISLLEICSVIGGKLRVRDRISIENSLYGRFGINPRSSISEILRKDTRNY